MVGEDKGEANVGGAEVAYRETIRKKAEVEGKYIKQTGGRGQYGHCEIILHPLPSATHENMHEMSTDELDALAKEIVGGPGGKWRVGKDHRLFFIYKIRGGSLPRAFISPNQTGLRRTLRSR